MVLWSVAAGYEEDESWEIDDQIELAGSGPIVTDSVTKNVVFWRTFVRSYWVMDWIENGYKLFWACAAPAPRA